MQLPCEENSEIQEFYGHRLKSEIEQNGCNWDFKKDKKDPPFDTYLLAEDSIGQHSDNIEHHLWFYQFQFFVR